ncbi:uncharacterized protein DFL_006899 [Arthrobotrys flagrans]|uniref:Extracellular membrane protein CFEM domain-containing protein n=1 Tax=Arthrobotrys flagrans TaxID=97331 RepID=A0A436ZUN7_ARTFL|nr:hypothetical protein DFL_006899 [Arthrobotrys flagrans]
MDVRSIYHNDLVLTVTLVSIYLLSSALDKYPWPTGVRVNKPTTVLAQDNTVSIFSDSALENLRPCASTCMDETSIAEWLRCRTPLMDGCFCRRGLTSIGRASLFDCAKAGCNGDYEVDGMALTSVYTSYCNEYLGQLQTTESPASNLARTTSGGGGGGGGDRTTVQTSRQTTNTIPTSTSTETPAIITTPPASGGLSKNASIGLGVGIGVLALGLIAWGIWFVLRRRKMRGRVNINKAFEDVEPEAAGSGGVAAVSPVRAELGDGLRGQAGPRSELE